MPQTQLIKDQCHSILKTIVEQFKHAIVYGKSVKHQPQRVGLSHELADEDIGELGGGIRSLCIARANYVSSYHR